jgi:ribosome-associated protein
MGPMTDDQTPLPESAEPTPTPTPTPGPRRRAGLPARDGRPGRARVEDGLDVGEAPPVDPDALALAHRIVDLAADKKASDIVLLDIHVLTSVADYLVICSGGSERQLGAIASGIIEALKDEDLLPIGREGGPSAHWALIDYGSVVVHVMAPPERDYYQLEQLWSDAPLLLHVQ